MQILSPVYAINNRNWNYKTNQNPNKNVNNRQPITFTGRKINLYNTLLEKFLKLFSGQFDKETMPKSILKHQITNSGQLLNFNMRLDNGCTLAVNKFMPDGNKVKKPYIAIKEFGNGAFKEFIGINPSTKELIYIGKDAKPLFQFGEYKKIPFYDENHAIHEYQLESYLKQIFPEETKAIRELNSAQQGKSVKPQNTNPNPSPKIQTADTASTPKPKAQPLNPPAFVFESSNPKVAAPEITPQTNLSTESHTVTKPAAKPKDSTKPERTARHRIKTVGRVPATLSNEIQENIKVISDIMDKLSQVRDKYPSAFKRARINDFKNNYEPIVYTNERTNRGVTFKFGEGETLKVVTMERKPQKYLGIIHTDKDGYPELLLIENGKNVVANTNPSNMSYIPPKTFHATKEELKEIPVAQYTEFLRESLEKYYSELDKVLRNKEPIKVKPAATPQTDKVIPQPAVQAKKTNPAADKPVPKPDFEKLTAEIKIPDNLNTELVEQINKQAAADAQRYVQQYMQAFTEQFSKLIKEKMSEFYEILSKFSGGK